MGVIDGSQQAERWDVRRSSIRKKVELSCISGIDLFPHKITKCIKVENNATQFQKQGKKCHKTSIQIQKALKPPPSPPSPPPPASASYFDQVG